MPRGLGLATVFSLAPELCSFWSLPSIPLGTAVCCGAEGFRTWALAADIRGLGLIHTCFSGLLRDLASESISLCFTVKVLTSLGCDEDPCKVLNTMPGTWLAQNKWKPWIFLPF